MASRRSATQIATKAIAAAAASAAMMVSLYVYQKEWIKDESRFKLAVKGRQEGFTFGTTLRHVRKRLAKTTIWISASDRQSREAIEYCKAPAALGRSVRITKTWNSPA
jgi:phage FluMu gp28-like protein